MVNQKLVKKKNGETKVDESKHGETKHRKRNHGKTKHGLFGKKLSVKNNMAKLSRQKKHGET